MTSLGERLTAQRDAQLAAVAKLSEAAINAAVEAKLAEVTQAAVDAAEVKAAEVAQAAVEERVAQVVADNGLIDTAAVAVDVPVDTGISVQKPL